MSTTVNPKNIVPSVNKAIDIIELIREKGGLTAKEIMAYLKLPASTCYKLVTTLESRGLIEKNPLDNKYALGVTLVKWGLRPNGESDLREIVVPHLRKLVKKFNETASLNVFNRSTYGVVLIEKVEGTQELRTTPEIGSEYPSYRTGVGKCLLAHLHPEQLEQFFHEVDFSRLDPPVSEEQLRRELEEVRRTGTAVSVNGLGTGATSVGAAVRDGQGKVIASIGLSGPMHRMAEQIPVMKNSLKRTALEISMELKRKTDNS